jgi:hypothetical protein
MMLVRAIIFLYVIVMRPELSQWMIITTQEDFIKWFEEVKSTVVNFWSDWVWEPLIRMMDTIRHRERRLVLMGKDSLNSDLEVRQFICYYIHKYY